MGVTSLSSLLNTTNTRETEKMPLKFGQEFTEWAEGTHGSGALDSVTESRFFATLMRGVEPDATESEQAMTLSFLEACNGEIASKLSGEDMPSELKEGMKALHEWQERQTVDKGASTASQADQEANDGPFAGVWSYEEHTTGIKDTPPASMGPQVPPGWCPSVVRALTVTLSHKTKGWARQEIRFWVSAHRCSGTLHCVEEEEKTHTVMTCYKQQLPDGWKLEDVDD
jgi:hypothetical protein